MLVVAATMNRMKVQWTMLQLSIKPFRHQSAVKMALEEQQRKDVRMLQALSSQTTRLTSSLDSLDMPLR